MTDTTDWKAEADALRRERDELAARLAEIEQAEPVAWIEHELQGTGLRHLHFERRPNTLRDDVIAPVWTALIARPACDWPGKCRHKRPAAAPELEPTGWKVVPVDPTPEMIDAADSVDWRDDDTRGSVINMWHCMLAAAPERAEPVQGPVWLTDERIAQIAAQTWGSAGIAPQSAAAFARAIEAWMLGASSPWSAAPERAADLGENIIEAQRAQIRTLTAERDAARAELAQAREGAGAMREKAAQQCDLLGGPIDMPAPDQIWVTANALAKAIRALPLPLPTGERQAVRLTDEQLLAAMPECHGSSLGKTWLLSAGRAIEAAVLKANGLGDQQ